MPERVKRAIGKAKRTVTYDSAGAPRIDRKAGVRQLTQGNRVFTSEGRSVNMRKKRLNLSFTRLPVRRESRM